MSIELFRYSVNTISLFFSIFVSTCLWIFHYIGYTVFEASRYNSQDYDVVIDLQSETDILSRYLCDNNISAKVSILFVCCASHKFLQVTEPLMITNEV